MKQVGRLEEKLTKTGSHKKTPKTNWKKEYIYFVKYNWNQTQPLLKFCNNCVPLGGKTDMGITGELVRSVFSKSRSTKTHDTNVRSNINGLDKKKWKSSVRAYLCGDELFNSMLAEEDSASVKSSEATVTQPVLEDHSADKAEDLYSQEATDNGASEQDQNHLTPKELDEDTAAIIIQSAFRGFMVRRLRMTEFAGMTSDFFKGIESPSRESLATSREVQTGNSVGVGSTQEGALSISNMLQNNKPKPLAFKQKDNWDDSTVDSSVARMRIQNRLEAMTRREKALAYAFSQQLRICSKKKQTKPDGTEPNMGWSWLERWMATRQPEASLVEDRISKPASEQATTMKTRAFVKKRLLDLSFEEKESCGSNEVPVQVDGSRNTATEFKDGGKTTRNKVKATKNISRRKTVPTHHSQKEHTKVSKGEGSKEVEKDKRQKVKQLGSKRETACKDAASLVLSPDQSLSGQNSKSDP